MTHSLCNRAAALAMLTLALMLVPAGTVIAQPTPDDAWPSKPIRMIVPWAPGGSPDAITRILMDKVSEQMSATFIVENRPGANGITGTDLVKRAAPDGYTFLVGTAGPFVINPHLQKSLPYDPLKDFSPVVLVARFPQLLAVNAEVPASTVAELIGLMKARPNKLNHGSAGIGTVGHVVASAFLRAAGVQATHIPFKGGGSLMQPLMAGDVQFAIDGLPTFFGPLKSGRVRALAVTTLERSPNLPNVATIAESGFPGFDFSQWILLAAPAGTPDPIVERLAKAVSLALRDEQVVARLGEMGATVAGGDPQTANDFLGTEYTKWKDVVIGSGAKLE